VTVEIDDVMGLATAAAQGVYGDRARISVEESPICTSDTTRWIAAVKVRGEVLTSRRGPKCGAALKSLVGELAARSRDVSRPHEAIAFGAAQLGV
jgi:hypothetical protein